MARGNCVIVTADPKGRFEEIFVSGTPKPGTCMELKWGTAAKGGRWTMEAAGTTAAVGATQGMAADGNRVPIAILLAGTDPHAATPPGGTLSDAYTDGQRGVVYYPANGEEMNILLQNQSGTADDFIPGSKLIVDDGTGLFLISAGSPESEPFVCLETVTDMLVDTHVFAMYTGN